MLPYKFCKQLFQEKFSNPILIAKGKAGVSTDALSNELRGIMRQIRRLSPTQEDNFSLNSVEAFSKAITGFFTTVNIVGAIIGGISLVVGIFGITNIMFVTVRERTSIIGLKKPSAPRVVPFFWIPDGSRVALHHRRVHRAGIRVHTYPDPFGPAQIPCLHFGTHAHHHHHHFASWPVCWRASSRFQSRKARSGRSDPQQIILSDKCWMLNYFLHSDT